MEFPDLIKIKKLRKSLKLSQTELAERVNLTQSTISRIENGQLDPPYSKVQQVFKFLENEKKKRTDANQTVEQIMTKVIKKLSPDSNLREAVKVMNEHNISQLPVFKDDKNIGSITSNKAQKLIIKNPDLLKVDLLSIMGLPFPEVDISWNLKDISHLLLKYPAVLIKNYQNYVGIITDADFLKLG
ncbi:MAG: helix-turn-helix domain-containing protein [Candidatus Lokiarchaeota archaeon]|nr:helix-turn-helix domain-containing protein [Candidatus Lokiarchaeota archaeon]MBD3200951.1 helix-turn-helix domain-containing protein [Candidatus Lokiarchaeota archaeon]